MNRVLKWIGGIILAIIISVLLFVLGYNSFYKWRQKQKYPDRITVVANYMQYACGECSVEMRVQSVNDKRYEFIIDHDITPIPKTKSSDELCDFVGQMQSRYQLGDESIKSFTIIGVLHKYPHGLPIFDCSRTPYFTVEKIKYGNDKWLGF